jgi:outer membrane protein assembly factor BamE (lipoprotein component of BamABCDE complex)
MGHPLKRSGPALRLVASLSLAALMAACTSDDTTRSGLFEPYRTDLPQGNYVTQEMLDQISVGASAEAVRRALGTPLLIDGFLPDRWSYVFRYKHPNGRVDQRHVSIVFDDDRRVSRIDADDLPTYESPSDPALPGFRPEAYDIED